VFSLNLSGCGDGASLIGYASLKLVGHFVVMEVESMLPARHLALAATLVALLAALQVQPADAAFGITSVAGAIELPGPPPPSVIPGSNEGPLAIVFPEVINGTVAGLGVAVDHDGSNVVAAPTISGSIVNPALVSTVIPGGAGFNSYMLHFDPVGSPFFAFYVSTISFDNPIIGVQLFSDGFPLEKPASNPYVGTLEAGDLQVSLNGGPALAYYPGGLASRGVEEDAFILSIVGNTLIVAGSANGPEIDQIRILTAPTLGPPVPEPAAALTWVVIAITCGVALTRLR
jgi:hypothetical protein